MNAWNIALSHIIAIILFSASQTCAKLSHSRTQVIFKIFKTSYSLRVTSNSLRFQVTPELST